MDKKRHRRGGSIMVALRALDGSASKLLRKAAALSKARKCDLELVHVVSIPYLPAIEGVSTRRDARLITEKCKRRLTTLAAHPALHRIKTTTCVVWDYPTADALVRLVLKRRPLMVLAESQRHTRIARPFLSNTDWELIRKCPCPLWLSKSAARKLDGPVVAALDPLHANAKPVALDAMILKQALALARGRAANVLAFHSYSLPAPPVTFGALDPFWIGLSERDIESYEARVRRELDRVAESQRIPRKNRILARGDAWATLPQVAKRSRASVVVMGAVSRSALKRVFIGHTAERTLDALDCDAVIVKPADFKTTVAPRRRPVYDMPAL